MLIAMQAHAENPPQELSRQTVDDYLRRQVSAREREEKERLSSWKNWDEKRAELRRELLEMLGLWPMPVRGDLQPVVTDQIERAGIVVEKLHFQSSPGLYVTANFYRPAKVERPLPTILYLCGHSRMEENGISFGNKAGYQHHGAWFARNGYCCLTIDTLQLGEIQGIHHGTRNENMWWWIARGYTPAGVEAWNGIRALDYLESRPEVDRSKIGVTGRSGGGAYTWSVMALDDRPVCCVPVAGITDLQNHIVDDCIKGHCDCMFMANRRGWDFGTLAAMVAPRPCLLSNTDKDGIFPLDGVVRVHVSMKKIYRDLKAEDRLGLLITEGPHKDTQDLQVPTFRWFNRWLKGVDEPITMVAEKLFTPAELKVFDTLPKDERNTRIHEEFVPTAPKIDSPKDMQTWQDLREKWLTDLSRQCFTNWPKSDVSLDARVIDESGSKGNEKRLEFTSEEGIRLHAKVIEPSEKTGQLRTIIHILSEDGTTFGNRQLKDAPQNERWVFLMPRTPARERSPNVDKEHAQLLRRFALVGSPLDEGRVWDIRRCLAAVRTLDEKPGPVALAGIGIGAGLALYAGIYEPEVSQLYLQDLPRSHREGPIFMNVLKVLDMEEGVALFLPRRIQMIGGDSKDWSWAESVGKLYPADRSAIEFRAEP